MSSACCIAAGAVYVWRKRSLQGVENIILWIILLNVLADLVAEVLNSAGHTTHVVYNLMMPVERVLTLLIYAIQAETIWAKRSYYVAIGLVATAAIASAAYYGGIQELHYFSNVISGIVVAVFSYTYLRAMVLGQTYHSRVLFYFGMANLIYYTLMVSAMSALPLAMRISYPFAGAILNINLVGYTFWSITLILGISWKKQRT
jgi:hypothetical protein